MNRLWLCFGLLALVGCRSVPEPAPVEPPEASPETIEMIETTPETVEPPSEPPSKPSAPAKAVTALDPPFFVKVAGECALTDKGAVYCINHHGDLELAVPGDVASLSACSDYGVVDSKGGLSFFDPVDGGDADPYRIRSGKVPTTGIREYFCGGCVLLDSGMGHCGPDSKAELKAEGPLRFVDDWDGGIGFIRADGTVSLHKAPDLKEAGFKATRLWVMVDNRAACVVTESGQVVCWGEAEFGLLGVPSPQYEAPHQDLFVVPGIKDAIDFHEDSDTVCVTRKSGKVTCWGASLPLRAEVAKHERRGPQTLPVDGVVSLSVLGTGYGTADRSHLIAVRKDGRVWQINDNTFRNQSALVEGTGKVKQVVMADRLTCTLDDSGAVSCMGHLKSRTDRRPEGLRKVALPKADFIAGGRWLMAVRGNKLEVHELGGGKPAKVVESMVFPKFEGRIVEHVSRQNHFFRSDSGRVWVMGRDANYDFALIVVAEKTKGLIEGFDCVLDTWKSYKCFDSKGKQTEQGQVTPEGGTYGFYPYATRPNNPLEMPTNSNWPGLKQVVGVAEVCALTADGLVHCRTNYGVYPVRGAVDLVHIEANGHGYCGIDKAGQLICWGINMVGELGPDNIMGVWRPVPVDADAGLLKGHLR